MCIILYYMLNNNKIFFVQCIIFIMKNKNEIMYCKSFYYLIIINILKKFIIYCDYFIFLKKYYTY